MTAETARKPAWAWSDVDDPNPHYPKCDRCDAFARWAIGDVGDAVEFDDITIRWMACGTHLNRTLTDANWNFDVVTVYDLTSPPERS